MDLRDPDQPASAVIAAFGLQPHPEGGHFRETWRDAPPGGGRGVATAIYFLLAAGERSHWHRVDADELWVWQAGDALTLTMSAEGETSTERVLGPDIGAGQTPQLLVPRNQWQAAEPQGFWTLVSCVVTPAFRFEGFTLAPPGWRPSRSG